MAPSAGGSPGPDLQALAASPCWENTEDLPSRITDYLVSSPLNHVEVVPPLGRIPWLHLIRLNSPLLCPPSALGSRWGAGPHICERVGFNSCLEPCRGVPGVASSP